MMQLMPIVNASGHVISDAEVSRIIPALQTAIDRDFLPRWGSLATPVKLQFFPMSAVASLPKDSWPMFINKHSNDPEALGWHTKEGTAIYGRVYAGDCMRYGISWTVDLTHEIFETLGDPDTLRVFKMKDGRIAAFEACDAVESDDCAYKVDGVLVSDFVIPSTYFNSNPKTGNFDFSGKLKAPCPSLTAGGYMSIFDGREWGQVHADFHDGLASHRSIRQGWRRTLRKTIHEVEGEDFEVVPDPAG